MKVKNKKVGDTGNKWGECTASPPKPTVTHHLKLIGMEEKHSKERAMRVEQNLVPQGDLSLGRKRGKGPGDRPDCGQ